MLVAGCSNDTSAPETGDHDARSNSGYALDDTLRLNDVQLKATHNSYHVEKPDNPIPQWMYSRDPLDVQLGEQGVRGVEIDTHYDETTGDIAVYHVPELDNGTTCHTFVECLSVLKAWSDAHQGHHALFVQIEPKEPSLNQTVDFAAYSDAMDRILLQVWPRDRLITPADVQGDAATLRDAVTEKGWPTLGETRGKALFYVNERSTFHDAYTRGGLDISGRALFPESHADESIGAIVILNTPAVSTADVVKQGFIVRTMCDGVPAPPTADVERQTALSSGAHIISTDYPVGTTEPDGGVSAFEIPAGTPSRCNPVTAPPDCKSTDVEAPNLLTR
jgi:hypothetical protein